MANPSSDNYFAKYRPAATATKSENYFAKYRPGYRGADQQDEIDPARPLESNFFGDMMTSLGIGGTNTSEMLGTMYGLAADDMDNALRTNSAEFREFLNQKKSPYLKSLEEARDARVNQQDTEFMKGAVRFWETVSSPYLSAAAVTEMLPDLAVGGAVGRVAMGGARAVMRDRLEDVATRDAAELTARKVGVTGAVTAETAMEGADPAGQTYNELMALPDELWLANPEFRASLGGNMDLLNDKKSEYALDLARNNFALGGLLSLGTRAIPGADTIEKALVGMPGPGGRISRGLTGFAAEAGQEAIQEGGGQTLTNVAVQTVDPNRATFEGVGEAAGAGAAPGGIIGGAMGLMTPSRPAEVTPPPPPELTPEEKLAQAKTVDEMISAAQEMAGTAADVNPAGGSAMAGPVTLSDYGDDGSVIGETLYSPNADGTVTVFERDAYGNTTDTNLVPKEQVPLLIEELRRAAPDAVVTIDQVIQQATAGADAEIPAPDQALLQQSPLNLEALRGVDTRLLEGEDRAEFVAAVNTARNPNASDAVRESALRTAAEIVGRSAAGATPLGQTPTLDSMLADREMQDTAPVTEMPPLGAVSQMNTRAGVEPPPVVGQPLLALDGQVAQGDLSVKTDTRPAAPRPARILGKATEQYSDEELATVIADDRTPAISRRGAQIELEARATQAAPVAAAPVAQQAGAVAAPISEIRTADAPILDEGTPVIWNQDGVETSVDFMGIETDPDTNERLARVMIGRVESLVPASQITLPQGTTLRERTAPTPAAPAAAPAATTGNFLSIPAPVSNVAAQPVAGQSTDAAARATAQQALDAWAASRGEQPLIIFGEPPADVAAGFNELADSLKATFGGTVVPYYDTDPEAPNGVAISGTAYVNLYNPDQGAPFTAAHETFHIFEAIAITERAQGLADTPAQELVDQFYSVFDDMTDAGKRAYAEKFLYKAELDQLSGPAREARLQELLAGDEIRSEMVADFMGNRLTDRKFLEDLAKADPSGFEQFVKRWLAAIDNLLDKLKGQRKNTQSAKIDEVIKDLNRAKMIAQSALINYRKSVRAVAQPGAGGVSFSARQETQRGQDTTQRAGGVQSDAESDRPGAGQVRGYPQYGEPVQGAISVNAVHYSNQARESLTGARYGSGARGAEARRVANSGNPELRNRIYFYVDTGNGITPEVSVGTVAHRVQLDNIYDVASGEIRERDANAFEEAVMAAGFDGYYVSEFGAGNQGAVVLLGSRHTAVPVSTGANDVRFSIRQSDFTDPEERVAVSTAQPTAKADRKSGYQPDSYSEKRVIDAQDIKESKVHVKRIVDALRKYNTLTGKGDAKKVMQELHDVVVENLLWLHDHVSPEARERAKLWYDGANRIAGDWAKKFDLDIRQTSGILAVFSPQMDWFKNVSLGERALVTLTRHADETWSDGMTQWAESWLAASADVATKTARSADLANMRRIAASGKKLKNLSNEDAAYFIRAFDEAYFPRNYRLVTPEGGFDAFVVNDDESTLASVTWGGFGTIEKAVSIFRNGTFRNIDTQLGGEHKVRNFYNNIADPNNPDGHVTIDTHAVAAAFVKPLSGTSVEVMHNLGGLGSTAATGASGSYALYADAYRDAAAQRGLLAREMQSITWEAVRALFPAELKSGLSERVNGIWDQVKTGDLTREQARSKIVELAGGVRAFAWEGGGTGAYAADGATSFETVIAEDPSKREVRTLDPKSAKDKIQVSLSAATKTIPGIRRLYDLAQGKDTAAHALLQDIAFDSLKHLLSNTSARINVEPATGLYGGGSEPSLSLTITFSDDERGSVLAALEKFAQNFNQEQIHVRQGTRDRVGTKYEDGSYATPTYRWELGSALPRKQIQKIIDESGLYGLTFGDTFVEAYYVGDVGNEQQFTEFEAAIERASGLLRKPASSVGRSVTRLWPYGYGDGAIGYDRIRGDVSPREAVTSKTAKRIAEYLQGAKVKVFEQAQDITAKQSEIQTQIARAYESLPDNDLKNPRVRKAYAELAKEVARQFNALPIKVEVLTGQGEPYPNSAAMRRDVLDNNHLFIFGTTPDTFGPEGSDFSSHPLLEDTGLKDQNGYPLLANDLLRAVHDYYAHTMAATQFGPKGEEAAWKNHMSMTANPWARWALTSETRGQNSWVNFRPEAEGLAIRDRPFANQKAALLPIEYTLTGDKAVDASMRELEKSLPDTAKRGSKPVKNVTPDIRFSRSESTDAPAVIRLGQTSNAKANAALTALREKLSVNPINPTELMDGDAAVTVSAFNGSLHISDIRSTAPGQGAASRLLDKVLAEADAANVRTTLFASNYGEAGLSTQDLVKWYERRGFDVIDESDDGVEMRRFPNTESDVRFSRRQTETPEFKRWFGDSKVVDADGQPLVVYHATPGLLSITEFDLDLANKNDPDIPVVGFHFTSSQESADTAGRYPWARPNAENVSLTSVYLSIQNPATRGDVLRVARSVQGTNQEITDALIAAGYDGVVMRMAPRLTDQMRKAIDNGDRVEFKPGHYLERDGENGIGYFADYAGGYITGYESVDDFLESEEDHYVAFKPTQIKSATGNRGTFDPENVNIRFSRRQQPFYSDLKNAVAGMPERMRTQPAKQWIQWLTSPSNQSRFGFKKDEVTWSGVEDYLNLRGKDKVTADEIVQYLTDNNVIVQDVVLGGEMQEPEVYPDGTYMLPESGETNDMWTWRRDMRLIADAEDLDIDDLLSELVDVSGQPMDPLYEGDSILPEFGGYTAGRPTGSFGYKAGAKENYREVLLTLPTSAPEPKFKSGADILAKKQVFVDGGWSPEAVDAAAVLLDDAGGKVLDAKRNYANSFNSKTRLTPLQIESGTIIDSIANAYKAALANAEKDIFRSSHWDTPNVLTHIRVDDRATAAGESVLFVNEVQSDWGQAARKKGVSTGPSFGEAAEIASAAFNRLSDKIYDDRSEPVFARIMDTGSNVRRFIQETPLDDMRAIFEELVPEDASQLTAIAKTYIDARTLRDSLTVRPSGVANAPFIADTESWVTLAIKRAIGMAVDGGYDKLAFVNGEQAAEMFDLSKRVGEIQYRDRGDDEYALEVYSPEGDIIHREMSASSEEVVNIIGKELAQKVINGEGTEIDDFRNTWRSISGLDLKVGGEGMVGFYDGIVPNILRKLAKKFGGKVGVEPIQIADQGTAPEQLTLTITDDLRKQVEEVGMPLFSRRQNISGNVPLAQWSLPRESTFKDDFIRKFQNKYIDVKRVVDAISSSRGVLDDRFDPNLKEELFHKRAAILTERFAKDEVRPLLKAVVDARMTIAEVEEYLHNRHAEERNIQIAKVNPKMPDGGSGLKTADARAYLAAIPAAKRRQLDAIGRMVDDITANTRNLLITSGLETQSTIDAWTNTYGSYVPLFREDADFMGNAGMGTGAGFSTQGAASRRATGSERPVVDILANLLMQRERVVVRAEKNRVAQAVYGMTVQNPNSEYWLPVNPDAKPTPTGMQALITELVDMGLSPGDADNIMKEPKVKDIDPKTGLVVEKINPRLRSMDNVFHVRVNGKDRFVFFNQNNERATEMVRALKNIDADQLSYAVGQVAKVTRWFASVNTQYNPIFGIINMLRDTQGALIQLDGTPIADKKGKVLGGVFPAMAEIYKAVRMDRAGNRATGPWADLWYKFQEVGGQTGYRDQFQDSAARAQALESEMNRMREGALKQAGRAVFDWLSDYNDAMENAVRLSAFKTALDNGQSEERAASIAKNLTVNFNRKGQVATEAGAWFAFFNAAVQGTTKMAQVLSGPTGKKVFAGGIMVGVAQALALAAAGFDDEEPPLFVRERNLIIPLFDENGRYLTVPMPLGYNVIPNLGRIITEFALSGGKDPGKRAADILTSMLDMFNPIGNAGMSMQTVAPTIADPFVALFENQDWTGNPIAREDFSSLNPTPGYLRTRDSASIVSKLASEFFNYASFGSEFEKGVFSPTPDQIDYFIGQLTGGVGRETLKLMQTGQSLITGEDLPLYKIPLGGRFIGQTTGKAAESNRFYASIERMNVHKATVDGLKESGRSPSAYLRENPEARLAQLAGREYRTIQNLNKRRREMLRRDASRESIRMIETQIETRMRRFNEQVAAIEE